MYADFLWCIKLDNEIAGKRYLYVVTPEEEDDSSAVEGSITSVKRQLSKLEKTLTRQLEIQAKRITHEVADFQVNALDQMNEKQDAFNEFVKGKFANLEKMLSHGKGQQK